MSVTIDANVTRLISNSVTIQWATTTAVDWVGYKISGQEEFIEVYNDLTHVGDTTGYLSLNNLTPNTDYYIVLKLEAVDDSITETDYPTVSFTTPAAGDLGASLQTKLTSIDTVLAIWETNIAITNINYTINNAEAQTVFLGTALSSGTFFITDIHDQDNLVVSFSNGGVTQSITLTIKISAAEAVNTKEDTPLPAIDVDMDSLLFPYIYFNPLEKPKGIVTAQEWNTIMKLLLHQGNYTAKALNQLDLTRLRRDFYANEINATAINTEDTSEDNIQAKLNYLAQLVNEVTLGQIPNNSIKEAQLEIEYAQSLAKKADLDLRSNYNTVTVERVSNGEYAKPMIPTYTLSATCTAYTAGTPVPSVVLSGANIEDKLPTDPITLTITNRRNASDALANSTVFNDYTTDNGPEDLIAFFQRTTNSSDYYFRCDSQNIIIDLKNLRTAQLNCVIATIVDGTMNVYLSHDNATWVHKKSYTHESYVQTCNLNSQGYRYIKIELNAVNIRCLYLSDVCGVFNAYKNNFILDNYTPKINDAIKILTPSNVNIEDVTENTFNNIPINYILKANSYEDLLLNTDNTFINVLQPDIIADITLTEDVTMLYLGSLFKDMPDGLYTFTVVNYKSYGPYLFLDSSLGTGADSYIYLSTSGSRYSNLSIFSKLGDYLSAIYPYAQGTSYGPQVQSGRFHISSNAYIVDSTSNPNSFKIPAGSHFQIRRIG